MKSNKITAEERDIASDKLGKLCSERKTCRQKWLATCLFYQADECAFRATVIELYLNDFATTTATKGSSCS